MLGAVRELMERASRFDKSLREVQTKQVFQKPVRREAREIVDFYFRDIREQLLIGDLNAQTLLDVDGRMQRLLEIAQKNSMVQTYRSEIKSLQRDLLSVEKAALQAGGHSPGPTLESVDRLILDTLSKLLPSAARSYEQAIIDLHSKNRVSWRGPATDFRESLRETLDHLAPDADVIAEPGFKLEKDATAPTMKQKVRFILRKRGMGKTAIQAPEAATQAVDEIVGTFVRSVYSRSNVSTHTPTDRDEILRIRDWVRVALCELLAIRVGA
jgi:hypothetical protein